MSEKKSKIEGTGKVYRFTLSQMLKNSTNRWTLLILLLFALASVPVMSLMGQGNMSAGGAEAFYVEVKSMAA